ncbi:MAG: PaaI family thioesterase [Anaerolineaceae bacterium]|nr:PaaI family thioesterase [Anaerolineaceae bacterium]
MTELEEARTYFANDKYATEATGVVIEAVGEHYAKCSLKLDERHLNAVGHVMGGVVYTMADLTFAVSTNFRTERPTVTNVAQVSYLNAPEGDTLYSESRLLKDGRKICFYEITIRDNTGKDIAVITMNGYHI